MTIIRQNLNYNEHVKYSVEIKNFGLAFKNPAMCYLQAVKFRFDGPNAYRSLWLTLRK